MTEEDCTATPQLPVLNGHYDDPEEEANGDFNEIPTLPKGRSLDVRLLSNWGDPIFIGLAGIEVFLESGKKAVVANISTTASASTGSLQSVADLSAFGSASWKCAVPSVGAPPPVVSITFDDASTQQSIAMIRIWNYNESRVHANRGVRKMELLLDGHLIFRGSFSPAFAAEEGDHGETILFTMSDSILEAIADNDVCLLPGALNNDLQIGTEPASRSTIIPQRPITSEQRAGALGEGGSRPGSRKISTPNVCPIEEAPSIKVLHIELVSSWGQRGLIGLAGVEFFDEEGDAISSDAIAAVTVDHGEGEGAMRLINGVNLSRDPSDMWLSKFNEDDRTTLTFTFNAPTIVAGMSIWNYNAGVELSYAGVKVMNIHGNGKPLRRNVLLRKATGFLYFDFVQDISFMDRRPSALASNFRPMTMSATGFIFELCLHSTWGDEFYIGLNGVELWDADDRPIKIRPQNLAAFPESINILPQVHGDPRRSENLINGINEDDRAEFSWLTPRLPNRIARVFFIFDKPTLVSRIVVYNYRKTPTRGVQHISITVDDVIAWSGELPMYIPGESDGKLIVGLREPAENL